VGGDARGAWSACRIRFKGPKGGTDTPAWQCRVFRPLHYPCCRDLAILQAWRAGRLIGRLERAHPRAGPQHAGLLVLQAPRSRQSSYSWRLSDVQFEQEYGSRPKVFRLHSSAPDRCGRTILWAALDYALRVARGWRGEGRRGDSETTARHLATPAATRSPIRAATSPIAKTPGLRVATAIRSLRW